MNNKSVGWILLLVLSVIWGSSFILIKKGLIGLSANEVGALRIVSAALVLAPSAVWRMKQATKRDWFPLIGTGLLGSLIPSFLFAVAQTRIESSVTGVLNTLVPLFTILIAYFAFNQRQDRKVFVGVAIGFIGSIFLVFAGESISLKGFNSYALLVVLATVCYAANLNLIKARLNHLHPITVTSLSLLVVGFFSAAYLFGSTTFSSKLASGEIWLPITYIAILGVVGTALALIIFNKILQLTNPVFTSSVTYIIPVIAVIWGVLDGENLFFSHYVGMAAVGIGVYIANSNRAAYKNTGNTK